MKCINYHGDLMMVCPFCDFEYTHITAAYTRLGSDEFEAEIVDGTEQRGHTPSRRSALVIAGHCENGHKWNIVLQQHKGNTYVEYESTGNIYDTDEDHVFFG